MCESILLQKGIAVALGSASKNARFILDKLGIARFFDVIIDGTKTTGAKPDPEVFLLAAEKMGLAPCKCVVFEDSQAGIEAAKSAGMAAVAVGDMENLKGADLWVGCLEAFITMKGKTAQISNETGGKEWSSI